MLFRSEYFFEQFSKNSNYKAEPHRIIWGSGDLDNTIIYPGFNKGFIGKISTPTRQNAKRKHLNWEG